METVVLAFFKQENLLYIKDICQKTIYIRFKIFKNITLLLAEKFGNMNIYQQTVLLKIIYDFRVQISFMKKYKFLIS